MDGQKNDMTVQTPVLDCRRLSKSYGNGGLALSELNLRAYSGRVIGLLGPNGSGKSTLIKLIAGLLVPTSGELYVSGKKIGTETKKIVSYLPERTYFDSSMKVIEAINLFSDFYSDFDRFKALSLLERLGVPLDAKFKTLSKGTKEKLQLVLVMSRNAELYLLDEPIAGVDPAARELILELIMSNYNKRSTIIISTHLITDIEPILDDAIFLSKGRVYLADSCENIRRNTGGDLDKLFREVFRC